MAYNSRSGRRQAFDLAVSRDASITNLTAANATFTDISATTGIFEDICAETIICTSNSIIHGDISVNGVGYFRDIIVQGDTTIRDDAFIVDDTTISGSLTVVDYLTVSGPITTSRLNTTDLSATTISGNNLYILGTTNIGIRTNPSGVIIGNSAQTYMDNNSPVSFRFGSTAAQDWFLSRATTNISPGFWPSLLGKGMSMKPSTGEIRLYSTGLNAFGSGIASASNYTDILTKYSLGSTSDIDVSYNDTINVRIDNITGYVGVGRGVTSPQFLLDVSGTTRINGGSNTSSKIVLGPSPSSSNLDYSSIIESVNEDTSNYGSDLRFSTHGSSSLATSTERMRITNVGTVGIGQTNIQSLLHIDTDFFNENGQRNSGILLTNNGPADTFYRGITNGTLTNEIHGAVNYTSDAGHLRLSAGGCSTTSRKSLIDLYGYPLNEMRVGTGGTVRMVCVSNGNVGIGNTNPYEMLDVYGTINIRTGGDIPTLKFSSASNTHTARIRGNLNNSDNFGLYFCPSGTTETMMIKPGGNVGIGTTTPVYPLQVDSFNNDTDFSANAYFDISTGGGLAPLNLPQSNVQVSIKAEKYVLSELGFIASNNYVTSDIRIKNNISDLEDGECLGILRNIKPKKYNYIDTLSKGSLPVYGFIAQDIQENIKYSTTLIKNIIPDYYDIVTPLSLSSDDNTIRIGLAYDKEYTISNDTPIRICISYKKSDDLSNNYIDKMINVMCKNYDEEEKELTFAHNLDISSIEDVSAIFFYGKQVDDFHILKKDAIWTVATAALQEVDRLQQQHHLDIERLKEAEAKQPKLFRGSLSLSGTSASTSINLDSHLGLTPGEFSLKSNPQVFLQNRTGWAQVRGSVVGDDLVIYTNTPDSTDMIDFMIAVE